MAAGYSPDDLYDLAGPATFERGEEYVDSVARLRVRGGTLQATVYGSEPYRVRLGVSGGLVGDCTCPQGEKGFFCKHLVAVGLAKLEGVGGDDEDDDEDEDGLEELRVHLAKLPHAELVDLLVDAAEADEHLATALWWTADNR